MKTGISIAVMLAGAGSTGGSDVSAQKPDRGKPPAIGPAPSLKLPAIQKQKLSNGLAVWIVEHHEVPLAQINLIVRSGSAADPIGKFGIGSLAAAMLDEGAGSRSALDLADALEFLAANLSTTSSFDYSAIRMSVPVSKLGEALPLMADVALRPTFPANELERLRKERLTAPAAGARQPGCAHPDGVSSSRLWADAPLRHIGERTAAGDRGVDRRRSAGVLPGALSSGQCDAPGSR